MAVKTKLKKLVAASMLVTFTHANAQIPVTDIASIAQQIIDYANQGLQYAQLLQQYNQQLTDYTLELQNLAALPGTLRNQVKGRFDLQSVSNLTDFGTSFSGGSMLIDPNAATYYNQVEALLKTVNGTTPQQIAQWNAKLTALGLAADPTTPEWQAAFETRMKYEAALDNLRSNSLMRKNAADRAQVAKQVTTEMQNLPENNTVGAIQLLAAQGSLAYAQTEELLKQQAIANQLTQKQQIEILTTEDEARDRRLEALRKQSTYVSNVQMPY